MNFVKKAQIEAHFQVHIRALLFDIVSTAILAKCFNYNNVFSIKNVIKLLKHTGINDHAIELEKDKQPSFELIYSQKPIELEIIKIYIKTNLANYFI